MKWFSRSNIEAQAVGLVWSLVRGASERMNSKKSEYCTSSISWVVFTKCSCSRRLRIRSDCSAVVVAVMNILTCVCSVHCAVPNDIYRAAIVFDEILLFRFRFTFLLFRMVQRRRRKGKWCMRLNGSHNIQKWWVHFPMKRRAFDHGWSIKIMNWLSECVKWQSAKVSCYRNERKRTKEEAEKTHTQRPRRCSMMYLRSKSCLDGLSIFHSPTCTCSSYEYACFGVHVSLSLSLFRSFLFFLLLHRQSCVHCAAGK